MPCSDATFISFSFAMLVDHFLTEFLDRHHAELNFGHAGFRSLHDKFLLAFRYLPAFLRGCTTVGWRWWW